MKLVIFAGGYGTRIAEKSDYIPKPMIKIGNKPILWHIIKYYSVFGFTEFIICGGYKIEIIKKYFNSQNKQLDRSWKVKVINTGKKNNTGERLRRVAKYLKSTFCLTYGDGLSNVDVNKLIKFHKSNKSVATLTAVKPQPHYGKIIFKGNMVYKFQEKNQNNEPWINGGFFVCEKQIFKYVKKNSVFESCTLPILSSKKKLSAYRHKHFWHCMDTLRDMRNLNSLWLLNKAPWKIWDE